jgi:hypothetical protein
LALNFVHRLRLVADFRQRTGVGQAEGFGIQQRVAETLRPQFQPVGVIGHRQ